MEIFDENNTKGYLEMGERLKTCPFCGGKADYYYDDYGIHAFCTKCDSRTGDFETKDEVLNAWNSRPIEDA